MRHALISPGCSLRFSILYLLSPQASKTWQMRACRKEILSLRGEQYVNAVYRTFLSFCCKRVQVMEGERFIISDKWEGTESVVEGFSPKNPDLPWRRPRCNIAKFVLV